MRQIRSSVFETNSSSSHSLTLDPKGMRDFSMIEGALKEGVIHVSIDRDYGWGWERIYRPENKIAYILSDIAADDFHRIANSQDPTGDLRSNHWRADEIIRAIEKATRCEIVVSFVGDDFYGLDHESRGVTDDLRRDPESLLNFIFSKDAYVQLGNDNSKPPTIVPSDIGDVAMFSHHYRDEPIDGVDVELEFSDSDKVAEIRSENTAYNFEAKFSAAWKLRGDIRDFRVEEVAITLFKPKKFDIFSFDSKSGTILDGSEKWVDEQSIRSVAMDAIHHRLLDLGTDHRFCLSPDLKIDVKVEIDTKEGYRSTDPHIIMKGKMDPDALVHLQSVFIENASPDEGPSL